MNTTERATPTAETMREHVPDSVDYPQSEKIGRLPDGRPIIVTLFYDDSPECPLDWWWAGTIFSLGRKHVHYSPERVRDAIENDADCVALSYHEHGPCIWYPADGPHPLGVEVGGPFDWDTVRLAGVWVPPDDLREELDQEGLAGKARRERLLQRCVEVCEAYTAWGNGEVYGYAWQVGEGEYLPDLPASRLHRVDFGRMDIAGDDGCSGYYSLGDLLEAATSSLAWWVERNPAD